jgi:hypothetical protein
MGHLTIHSQVHPAAVAQGGGRPSGAFSSMPDPTAGSPAALALPMDARFADQASVRPAASRRPAAGTIAAGQGAAMAWRITGQLVETCSCNMLCPCYFGVPELAIPDQGWCAMAFLFRIREGQSDGVDLDGLDAVVVLDFPGNPYLGGGTARLYLDGRGSAAQQSELEAFLTGERGGPWGVVCSLLTSWLPTRTGQIVVDEQGDVLVGTVGEVGQLRSTLMRAPDGRATTLQAFGFGCAIEIDAVELAPSGSRWQDPEVRRFETRSGSRSTFDWHG